jgi:FtsP/CotA-like multicopper oxidase with cupredoxin domain
MEHVCIKLDHESSHKQLWVLKNLTGTLHNFHIHQMKFRLARIDELEMHGIKPNGVSHTCAAPEACGGGPDFGLYDERRVSAGDQEPEITWHDTIPVPDGLTVFIIMSYDANQQIGRFVFHCHILKHEDVGLMAPIEVWSPQMAASSR